MKLWSLEEKLCANTYPGRGMVIGKSKDGTHAIIAYFIMGRSENSRNRIFVEEGEGIRTQAFDQTKLKDPSLIIYAPVRVIGNCTIVTNGDQTDTIYEGIRQNKTFEESLRAREFEPDAPNFTPRISGILYMENKTFRYDMSILKSDNGNPKSCNRFTFSYENPQNGEGRYLHTYQKDDKVLPSFEGEPHRVALENDADSFTNRIWDSLNSENKVSLFVRYINLATGESVSRIVNKNQ